MLVLIKYLRKKFPFGMESISNSVVNLRDNHELNVTIQSVRRLPKYTLVITWKDCPFS